MKIKDMGLNGIPGYWIDARQSGQEGGMNMKKITTLLMTLALSISMTALTGCSSQVEDPGPPPPEVINPDNPTAPFPDGNTEDGTQDGNSKTTGEESILENAISVVIGRDGQTGWNVNMYDNDAAWTMLGYLSDSGLLFPT